MSIYIIILAILFIVILALYIIIKRSNKPTASSIMERNKLEKMLEKELLPNGKPKEEAEKEDFRYRDDYQRNISTTATGNQKKDENESILKNGIIKYKAGRLDGAELEFSKVIESDVSNATAYYYRGLIKNQRKEYTGAVSDFDLAYASGFQEPDLHMQRGVANLNLMLFDKASSDFSIYLSRIPNSKEAHYNKGLADFGQDLFPEAVSEFTKVIEVNPDHELAYFERGKSLLKIGNKEEACRDFNEAFKRGCSPAEEYIKTICNNRESD